MATQTPYGKINKVNLRADDFDKLVWAHGIHVRHDKTALCPHQYNTKSNHKDINCDICDNGRIHFDSREVWVLFYQKKMEEMFQVQGVWELGDVLVTLPGKYEDGEVIRVDYYDRITLLDFTERTSDLITRALSGDIDSPRYEVKDVDYLRTKTTIYIKDTDFEVSNGDIKWLTGNRPTAAEVYTLSYTYPPVYRVINFFHEQRYYYDSRKQPAGVRVPRYLPIQAQVRRDYVIDDRKGYD